jgi:hypothetical protein
MVPPASPTNGRPPNSGLLSRARLPESKPSTIFRLYLIVPLLAVAAILLSGCVTTQTTVTTTKAQCAAWRKITYSWKDGDSQPTIRQIRVHNAVGRKLSCWR